MLLLYLGSAMAANTMKYGVTSGVMRPLSLRLCCGSAQARLGARMHACARWAARARHVLASVSPLTQGLRHPVLQ